MNRVCEVLGIEKPVIQGPMAWISTAPLVAAVSNAGGLGVLGVGFAPEPFIRDQIAKTRELTDKPFGMNCFMIPDNLDHVTGIITSEKPPVVYAETIDGLDRDLCKKYFDIWHEAGCKMPNVRRYAQKAGVKFIDRVGIVELLKDNDRISGAVGFNIDDGSKVVFQCKAVILCTGAQNYRIMPMRAGGRGEGIRAAWNAGALFKNCEMGSFYNWTSLENFESSMGVEYAIYNNKGENVCKDIVAGHHSDVDAYSLAEYYKQVKAGNGPLTYRMPENPLMPFLQPM